MLQHKDRAMAPAKANPQLRSKKREDEGVLGTVPHTIRASVSSFEQNVYTGLKFDQCTACGLDVLQAISNQQFEFLKQALAIDGDKFLRKASGIESLVSQMNDVDLEAIAMSDEDD